jgi:tetratricopeptide (TPR) repeat protein
MSQLVFCTVAGILLLGSGFAADMPFVYGKNFSELCSSDSNQLEEASALSDDLKGIQQASSLDDDYTIEVTLFARSSTIESSSNKNSTESRINLPGLLALDQSSIANETNISVEMFETRLLPDLYKGPPISVPSSSPTYWFEEGNKNYNDSNYQEAIDCYDLAIKLGPQLKEAWCNKGIALCKLGKYQDAVNAFDEAIHIDFDYSNAWRNKGRALKDMGREDEAEHAFQNAS